MNAPCAKAMKIGENIPDTDDSTGSLKKKPNIKQARMWIMMVPIAKIRAFLRTPSFDELI